MRKYLLTFFLFLVIATGVYSQKQQVWMLGPMLHVNFSNKERHTSFGIELAYWNYDHFPYSVDWGIDFEKKKTRLYTEAQTGIGFLGLSMGPVLEYCSDERTFKGGIQGSTWCNYFGGVDLRFRKNGGSFYISPGIYFKVPFGFGDTDGDYDHWDWDFDD